MKQPLQRLGLGLDLLPITPEETPEVLVEAVRVPLHGKLLQRPQVDLRLDDVGQAFLSKAEPSALPATFCGSSLIFTLTSRKPAGVGYLNLLLLLTMSTPS